MTDPRGQRLPFCSSDRCALRLHRSKLKGAVDRGRSELLQRRQWRNSRLASLIVALRAMRFIEGGGERIVRRNSGNNGRYEHGQG